MRRSATKPHVSGAGVECWVQNRHLRHRHVHVSLNNPERVQVLHLITCYRNLSIYISSFKNRETVNKRKTKKVFLDQRVHEGLTLTCCLGRRGH